MVILELISIYLCGAFFGAALYISVAQHPASMKAGVAVAGKFFPPMYALAAPLQIATAIGGTLCGFSEYYLSGDILWAVGATVLVSVIPYTVIVLKPINDQLLDTNVQRSESETKQLLEQWAPRHWVRTVLSGISFALYTWVGVG